MRAIRINRAPAKASRRFIFLGEEAIRSGLGAVNATVGGTGALVCGFEGQKCVDLGRGRERCHGLA